MDGKEDPALFDDAWRRLPILLGARSVDGLEQRVEGCARLVLFPMTGL